MSRQNGEAIVLIPALEPDAKLLNYVQKLREYNLTEVIVVDDGSGEKYRGIFEALQKDECVVLRHLKNQGKGCALKTGFRYIEENFSEFTLVVTADSDGQHAPGDVYRLAKEAKNRPEALLLGVRDFSGGKIPPKSLIGNKISSLAFAALYGKKLSDTQTGLRAFGPLLLPLMQRVPGERFEYELEVLISCVRAKIPIVSLPIEVIYEDQNAGTHFKPIRDSMRVLGVLGGSFFKFALSSAVGAAVDLGAAFFLLDFLKPAFEGGEYVRILLATLLARTLSIAVNYVLNRNFVFRGEKAQKSLGRYLALCGVVVMLSGTGVYLLRALFFLNEKSAKLVCDTILFLLSYGVQRRWVFAKGGEKLRAK